MEKLNKQTDKMQRAIEQYRDIQQAGSKFDKNRSIGEILEDNIEWKNNDRVNLFSKEAL